MAADEMYDLVVIGGGPAGYTAAIRASQLGMKVACVEQEERLGGTCLRVGCIPSKALLEASERYAEAKHELGVFGVKVQGVELDLPTMQTRMHDTVDTLTRGIDGLFKKNKVTRVLGTGRIVAAGKVAVDGGTPAELNCKNILVATGSVASSLPGIELDGEFVGTSTEALTYPGVPQHLVVIGAGVIGLELGSVWLRLGAKVTVVEYLQRILPGMDDEIAKEAHKLFKKQGFEFMLGSRVAGARKQGDGCVVEIADAEPVHCDRVLVAVGRRPNTQGLGLEAIGIEPDRRGCVPVNGKFETAIPGIFAVGDVIVGPMLAHKAEEEAIACVEMIATGFGHVDYNTIPGVVYTNPEIASVGKTEEELKDSGTPYRKGSFSFIANGRARALGQTDGRVKMLAHKDTDRILGVHIIGPRAGALIAECAAAMTFGASSEDIARTCHAHPTLAEAVKEAALAVHGRTLNL